MLAKLFFLECKQDPFLLKKAEGNLFFCSGVFFNNE